MEFINFDHPDYVMLSSFAFRGADDGFGFFGEVSDDGFDFDAFQNDLNDTPYNVDLSGFYRSTDYMTYQGHMPGTNPIHLACGLGRLDVVRQLLKKGISINIKDEKGWTPIFYATLEGHAQLVEFLCSRKARLYVKSKAKITVLDLARQIKNTEIINILQKYSPKYRILQFFKSIFLFWK